MRVGDLFKSCKKGSQKYGVITVFNSQHGSSFSSVITTHKLLTNKIYQKNISDTKCQFQLPIQRNLFCEITVPWSLNLLKQEKPQIGRQGNYFVSWKFGCNKESFPLIHLNFTAMNRVHSFQVSLNIFATKSLILLNIYISCWTIWCTHELSLTISTRQDRLEYSKDNLTVSIT